METQSREPAAREASGAEIGFGVGAVYGAAVPPQAARRFHRVVRFAPARRRGGRQGEEGAGLVERRTQRRRVDAMADDVEQVAMGPDGRVGPLPWRAGAVEADVERAAAGAVEVARDPVAPLPAVVGKIAAAHLLGALGERGGDAGRVHGAGRAGRRAVMHGEPPFIEDGPFRYRPALPLGGAGERAPGARRGREAPAGADSKPERKKGPMPKHRPEVEGWEGGTPRTESRYRGRPSAPGAPLAGAESPFTDAAPLPLSRNCTRPPGTRRISVENRSESSPSFFQRRVCILPAT